MPTIYAADHASVIEIPDLDLSPEASMSDLRKTTGPIRLALKAAVRRALTMAGGGESVQHSTRVQAPALSRYSNPERPEDHCPLDVALDLDLEVGEPIILAALAEAQGYDLSKRVPQIVSDMPWCAKIGMLSRQDSQIIGALGEALTDGKISPAEGRCIVGEIDKEMDLLRRLKERVQAESGARS